MKKALVIADSRLRDARIDYQFVANVHDEWQVEVREDQAEAAGVILRDAIIEAGEDLRCPLDGEYMIGDDWSATH